MREEREVVCKLFSEERVIDLLLRELLPLPKNIYRLEVAYDKLIVTVLLHEYHGELPAELREELSNLRAKRSTDIESRYVMKIKKSYPLKGSVRIHLLEGGFQPKVCDGRDFFEEVMGRAYDYDVHLKDIIRPLIDFDAKLHHKNELFLQMQRAGKFQLGDTYYYH